MTLQSIDEFELVTDRVVVVVEMEVSVVVILASPITTNRLAEISTPAITIADAIAR
jgi:hypothetical protein